MDGSSFNTVAQSIGSAPGRLNSWLSFIVTRQEARLGRFRQQPEQNPGQFLPVLTSSPSRKSAPAKPKARSKDLLSDAIYRIQGVVIINARLHKSGTGRIDLAACLPNLARAALTAETEDASVLEVDVRSVGL